LFITKYKVLRPATVVKTSAVFFKPKNDHVMLTLQIVLKVVIGLGILKVWLLPSKNSPQWRGGKNNKSLKEEFAAYGFSPQIMKVVGVFKVALALLLLASLYFTTVEIYAVIGLLAFMTVAFGVHVVLWFKERDPMKKALPSGSILVGLIILLLV
jgi:hypothetical protein